MRKVGKALLAIICVLIITGLLCLMQYTIHPIKTDFSRTTPGYLLNSQGDELIYTKIMAEVHGRWWHYLFRTEKESTRCEVYVDGYDITQGGASIPHYNKDAAGSAAEYRQEGLKDHIKFFYMTRKCETVILGVENAVSIPGNKLQDASGNSITLFVISADAPEEAQMVIKEAAEDSSQLKDCLNKYGFLK